MNHNPSEENPTHGTKIFGFGYRDDAGVFPLDWQSAGLPVGTKEEEESRMIFVYGLGGGTGIRQA